MAKLEPTPAVIVPARIVVPASAVTPPQPVTPAPYQP